MQNRVKGGAAGRYLQKIGLSYYVRVRVPPSLAGIVGNTHIRKALGTRDPHEAERRKWSEVQRIKAELARLSSADPLTVSAETYRRALAANPGPDATENEDTQREVLLAQAEIRAEQIAEQKGPEAAQQWYTLATTDRKTVGELVTQWLASSSYTKQTRRQHEQAWKGLRKYLGGDCLPERVDDDVAIAYVETIKLSGASYNTQRRKLNSLIGLWDWLALRKHVARGVNPWRGFRLSNRNSGAREALHGRGTPRAPQRVALVPRAARPDPA